MFIIKWDAEPLSSIGKMERRPYSAWRSKATAYAVVTPVGREQCGALTPPLFLPVLSLDRYDEPRDLKCLSWELILLKILLDFHLGAYQNGRLKSGAKLAKLPRPKQTVLPLPTG